MSKEYWEIDERRGYQWPASGLTGREMAILAHWKDITKTPINELLRQCIIEMNRVVTKKGDNK